VNAFAVKEGSAFTSALSESAARAMEKFQNGRTWISETGAPTTAVSLKEPDANGKILISGISEFEVDAENQVRVVNAFSPKEGSLFTTALTEAAARALSDYQNGRTWINEKGAPTTSVSLKQPDASGKILISGISEFEVDLENRVRVVNAFTPKEGSLFNTSLTESGARSMEDFQNGRTWINENGAPTTAISLKEPDASGKILISGISEFEVDADNQVRVVNAFSPKDGSLFTATLSESAARGLVDFQNGRTWINPQGAPTTSISLKAPDDSGKILISGISEFEVDAENRVRVVNAFSPKDGSVFVDSLSESAAQQMEDFQNGRTWINESGAPTTAVSLKKPDVSGQIMVSGISEFEVDAQNQVRVVNAFSAKEGSVFTAALNESTARNMEDFQNGRTWINESGAPTISIALKKPDADGKIIVSGISEFEVDAENRVRIVNAFSAKDGSVFTPTLSESAARNMEDYQNGRTWISESGAPTTSVGLKRPDASGKILIASISEFEVDSENRVRLVNAFSPKDGSMEVGLRLHSPNLQPGVRQISKMHEHGSAKRAPQPPPSRLRSRILVAWFLSAAFPNSKWMLKIACAWSMPSAQKTAAFSIHPLPKPPRAG
jgi:hypothetical protein